MHGNARWVLGIAQIPDRPHGGTGVDLPPKDQYGRASVYADVLLAHSLQNSFLLVKMIQVKTLQLQCKCCCNVCSRGDSRLWSCMHMYACNNCDALRL